MFDGNFRVVSLFINFNIIYKYYHDKHFSRSMVQNIRWLVGCFGFNDPCWSSYRAVSTTFIGFHTEAARRCAVAVRGPYDQRSKNYYLKSCEFRKNTARPPHAARMMLLRHVYGIYTGSRVFFKFAKVIIK